MSIVDKIKNIPAVKNPKKFMKDVSDMPGTVPDRALNGIDSVGVAGARKLSRGRRALNDKHDIKIPGVRDSMKGVAKTAVRKDPHGQNFGNGYTGFKEGGGMIAAAGVGGVAYAGIAYNYQTKMPEKPGETTYTGTAEIHNYDGVSSAPTLGASGDTVLGMHRGRKG